MRAKVLVCKGFGASRFWYVKVRMQKSSKAATDLVAAFEIYISKF